VFAILLRSLAALNRRSRVTWLTSAAPASFRCDGRESRCIIGSSCLLTFGAAQVLRQTLGWLKEEKAMQAERARLGLYEPQENVPN
jgi:hypothetical protein